MNVKPILATVAPRIQLNGIASFPAVDMLCDVIDSRRTVKIAIVGGKGWGKSVALAHLAASFPDRDNLQFWDSPKPVQNAHPNARVTVIACRSEPEALKQNAECWTLTEWGLDEALEYLMSCHRSACARLMPMLHSHALSGLLPRRPVLWRKLLDLLVQDASIATVQEGFDQIVQLLVNCPTLHRHTPGSLGVETKTLAVRHEIYRTAFAPFAKAFLLDDEKSRERIVEPLVAQLKSSPSEFEFVRYALGLISEEAIFVPIALNGFVDELSEQSSPQFLTSSRENRLNTRAIELIARRVAKDPSLIEKLNHLIASDSESQSMAVSVICRAVPNWRSKHPLPFLRHGKFDGVNWDGAVFGTAPKSNDKEIASVSRASFRGASLVGASLLGCFAISTNFSNANLSLADLSALGGRDVIFSGAVLRRAKFNRAMLKRANFSGADCTSANFESTWLQDADLRSACFESANLRNCKLGGANLEGTDFSRADLSGVLGRYLDFRQSILQQACFHRAKLRDCDFEGQTLPMVDFIEADLSTTIFSSTVIENGSFFGANLSNARLGDINWEYCDLRNANLRGATFHFGSTRSGLVGSPYPSHGTRTGFYTDDFYDQPFKAPEEIRKANLRSADLRGANLRNVDFYLVDLRDARLDPDQVEHVRQCGAIMPTRA